MRHAVPAEYLADHIDAAIAVFPPACAAIEIAHAAGEERIDTEQHLLIHAGAGIRWGPLVGKIHQQDHRADLSLELELGPVDQLQRSLGAADFQFTVVETDIVRSPAAG